MDWYPQRRTLAAAAVAVMAACGGGGGGKTGESRADSFKRAILDFNGHVIVMKATAEFSEYREVAAQAAKIPGVVSTQPFVFIEVTVKVGGTDEPIGLKGIELSATPLAGHVTPRNALDGYVPIVPVAPAPLDPAPDDFGGPEDAARAGLPTIHVAIGVALAKRLGVAIGDTVEIAVPPPVDPDTWRRDGEPQRRTVRVVALMETTVEYDERTMLTTLAAAQALQDQGDTVMGLELRVTKIEEAARLAKELGNQLGAPYQVLDWCELNKQVLRC